MLETIKKTRHYWREEGLKGLLMPGGRLHRKITQLYVKSQYNSFYVPGLTIFQSFQLSLNNSRPIMVLQKRNECLTLDLLNLDVYWSPNIIESVHGTPYHQKKMEKIYQKSNFCEIEHGDTILDVGAYVGGFSMAASEKASKLIAVDPTSKSFDCLEKNLGRLNTDFTIISKAAWNERDKINLKISYKPNDSSLLDIEAEKVREKIEVDAIPLRDILVDNKTHKINFAKIEAEGAEPEILDGLFCEDINIDKIVVNCGPERYGNAPTKKVIDKLKKQGFDIKVSRENMWEADIVYGVK